MFQMCFSGDMSKRVAIIPSHFEMFGVKADENAATVIFLVQNNPTEKMEARVSSTSIRPKISHYRHENHMYSADGSPGKHVTRKTKYDTSNPKKQVDTNNPKNQVKQYSFCFELGPRRATSCFNFSTQTTNCEASCLNEW